MNLLVIIINVQIAIYFRAEQYNCEGSPPDPAEVRASRSVIGRSYPELEHYKLYTPERLTIHVSGTLCPGRDSCAIVMSGTAPFSGSLQAPSPARSALHSQL